jgi:hypothetical protein
MAFGCLAEVLSGTTRPNPNRIRAEMKREDCSLAGEGTYAAAVDRQTMTATTQGFALAVAAVHDADGVGPHLNRRSRRQAPVSGLMIDMAGGHMLPPILSPHLGNDDLFRGERHVDLVHLPGPWCEAADAAANRRQNMGRDLHRGAASRGRVSALPAEPPVHFPMNRHCPV